MLELIHPRALWALVALGWLWWFHRRSLVDLGVWQRRASFALRCAIVALVTLALSGVTWVRDSNDVMVVFAIDESESVDGDEARVARDAYLDRALPALVGRADVRWLAFSEDPRAVETRDGLEAKPVARRGSDLEAAVTSAAAMVPPTHRGLVVLLSDGRETRGDVMRAAGTSSVAVSTVPLPVKSDLRVQVTEVRTPTEVREGEPFHVEVVIHASEPCEGEVELFRGPHRVASEHRRLEAGENVFRVRQSIEGERLVIFTGSVRGFGDQDLDDDRASGLVFTRGKPRVLLIAEDERAGRHLRRALEREDVVCEIRPPQGLPRTLTELAGFEAVVLANVPATAFEHADMERLRAFVQELGGGLLMLGGDRSFGLGGYYRTVVEEILPVRSDFEKEKEKPSLAMVLVIDKSGSMGGHKIELAKDAARGAVELLGVRDFVGVLAFDGQPLWVSEIHPCSDAPYVLNRVASLSAGGGTNLQPAMEQAFEALDRVQARLKHVIILSDGISQKGDFQSVAGRMRAAGMTVSTVGIGEGAHQELLQQIARIGGGRNYFTNDPSTIPQIFARETITASQSAIDELPFQAQVARAHPALNEIAFDQAPYLLGHVVTRAKATCEVILATETGDPLLAWWRYGLGHSAAFTSDATDLWASEWLAWPGFSRFWVQVVRQIMRRREARGFEVAVTRREGVTRLALDAIGEDGEHLNDARGRVLAVGPEGERSEVALHQVAPGRYEASLPMASRGPHHLETELQGTDGKTVRESRGVHVGFHEELRIGPVDEELLRALADAGGGAYSPAPEALLEQVRGTARRPVALTPWLLALASLLFVLDVFLRRFDLQRRPSA